MTRTNGGLSSESKMSECIWEALSPCEKETIILVAQGKKNREIAQKMKISDQTVKNRLYNIFNELGVTNRTELAHYAMNNGWVETPRVSTCT